jgi:Flp pilus assembly protein TadD
MAANNQCYEALHNQGTIKYEQSSFEEATILFLKALAIKPDDEDTLCNLGLALRKI